MGKRGKRKSTRAKFVALGVGFFLFCFPLPLFPRSPFLLAPHAVLVSTATREGRLAVFDDAWERINERYYDQTFHGVDWDQQRRTFRVQAAAAGSTWDFYAVLRQMIASLNDPHTRVFAPEEKFDWWRPRFVSVGLTIAEVRGLPTVVSVDPKSEARRAGLRAGDVLEAVNGTAALSLVKSQSAHAPNLTRASERLRIFSKLLEGPSDTTVEIAWKDKDGKQRLARLKRYWQQRELGVRMQHKRGEYAVVTLEVFTKPIATAFARGLKQKLRNARGVIIDLRSNGGGDAEAMSDIASSFLKLGTNLGRFTDRAGTSFTISTHSKSLLSADPIPHTALPLIVLTSERTASAAEIFVAALRDSGRATIIGAETCGCVLAVRTQHLLPDGGLLDVSELDFETAQGHRLEGHGLKPDETVPIDRWDLYARRDRAMELAVEELSRRVVAHY